MRWGFGTAGTIAGVAVGLGAAAAQELGASDPVWVAMAVAAGALLLLSFIVSIRAWTGSNRQRSHSETKYGAPVELWVKFIAGARS
jgi:hypothetical protein